MIPRRLRARKQVASAANLFAYSYVDGAKPVFQTVWGSGNNVNGRVNIAPTQKRIIIDGTTSTNGNYRHVSDLTAALAIYAAGDWILYPGGQTSTPSGTVSINNMAGGTSLSVPTVFGTFDPADKENDAKYNTLVHKMDFTAAAGSALDAFTGFGTGGNLIFNSFNFYAPVGSAACSVRMLGSLLGNGRSVDNLLFENVRTDGVNIIVDSQTTNNLGCTITRSGTTATVTLTNANALLQTGDVVVITGAAQGAYNISASITVTDSTHFTYTVAGSPTTPATGSIFYNPPFVRVPDSMVRKNVEFRYCGLMYGGNGTVSGTLGNVYISGIRGWRVAACVDFHPYPRGTDRTTAASSGGPSQLMHGFYIDDFTDAGTDGGFFDHVNGWDASNLKLTGGNYWLQNLVSIRCPISFIYASETSNHENSSWPAGSTFQSTHHLAINSEDINSTDPFPRGWGPQIYETMATGSYYKKGVLLNNDSPANSGRRGLTAGNNGYNWTQSLLVDGCILGNWNYQDTNTTPDGNMTVTFTNNWWDNASSGSNTQISSLPGATQTKITAALALNVHTTLRQAMPNFFSGVAVGGSNLATEVNMMEFMCQNPIPDPAVAMGWAIPIQYHFRSALA